MISAGSVVVVHMVNPTEKAWGLLARIDGSGVVLRGINLAAFDDWMLEVSGGEKPSLGLTTTFVPMFRVERIFLDEQVGEVESYSQRFERTVGASVSDFLTGVEDAGPPPN